MNVTFDKYFFEALASVIGVGILIFAVCAVGMKYKRLGYIVYVIFMIALASFDLTQCSELAAKSMRPQQEYRISK